MCINLLWWPDGPEISEFYWRDLHENYDWDTEVAKIDVGGGVYTMDIPGGTTVLDPFKVGPMWVNGTLKIKGKGFVELTGTIYTTGGFETESNPDYALLLNHNTIFAEGSIVIDPGIDVFQAGCIVALGDLDYQPNLSSDDFVFLMSLAGIVKLRPGGDFIGSVAGQASVELLPGTSLVHPPEVPDGLNFPQGEFELSEYWGIVSWEIG